MTREPVEQAARPNIPQTDGEVYPSRDKVCGVVPWVFVVWVEQAVYPASVASQQLVTRPGVVLVMSASKKV